MTADDYYRQGNCHRQHGRWHEAINCYSEAVKLDADSPAAEARQMLTDILNYRNNDLYNP